MRDPVQNSIARNAAAVTRKAEKLEQQRRRRSASPVVDRARNLGERTKETPGPGDYQPESKHAEGRRQKLARSLNSTFRSRSVRALPWSNRAEGGAAAAAASDDNESEGPGPGAYEQPKAFGPATRTTKAKGAIFGRTTSPRFAEPAAEQLTPSPMHYFHNAL